MRITVKKIVWTEEEAAAEVERLNGLLDEEPEGRGEGSFYFAQYTRVFDEAGSVRGD